MRRRTAEDSGGSEPTHTGITPGTMLGRYEIRDLLGAGGMGEVYRALDGQLGREAAVKVLPAAVGGDKDRLDRFEREARAVAALAHPNILTIYDFGVDDDRAFAAMELLEGESLRERLARGPLPIHKAINLARQLAEGLGAAHDRGIVHRDLKPDNIFVTRDGQVKVLDFGLAFDAGAFEAAGSNTSAPTSTRLTAPGAVMGTVGYMAPEQVRGEPTDARSDIFAFGCVLYEMLSGRPAFERDTAAESMTAILRDDPVELDGAIGGPAAALERVVRRCLEKNPAERFQSARDLAFSIRTSSTSSGAAPVADSRPARKTRAWLPWLVTAAMVAILAAVVLRPTHEPLKVVSNLVPPPDHLFNVTDGPPVVCKDGRQIAFLAARTGEPNHLFVRSLERTEAVRLEKTANASMPFWSPDGAFIGFFADGMLKTIEVAGGRPEAIAPAPAPGGGSWSENGTILFVADYNRPPQLIDIQSGEVRRLPEPFPGRFEPWYLWPQILPDGEHYLILLQDLGGPHSGILVTSLADPTASRILTRRISRADYAEPGWLLFWEDGSVKAHLFDTGSFELGEGRRIAANVGWGQYYAYGRFSLSQNGVLVYQQGAGAIGDTELVVADRSGKTLEVVGERAEYYAPRLSHDGLRIAVDVTDIQITQGDIWIFEPARNTRARLTHESLDESDSIWLPDDSEVIYRRVPDLYRRDAAAADEEQTLLVDGVSKEPEDISPDGRYLLYEVDSGGDADLWTLDMESSESRPWLESSFREEGARFSPNGRWVAYETNESGTVEISVRSFPDGRDRIVVSTSGGSYPVWRADGSELFYYSASSEITAVPVTWTGGRPFLGEPRPLFKTRLRDGGESEFDVYPDGQTFLLNRVVTEVEDEPLTLVQNWDAGLVR